MFLDCGGETQSFTALDSSLVFNRTNFTNVVQQPAAVALHPLAAGGPNAGEYGVNGLFVAENPAASVHVQVRWPATAFFGACLQRREYYKG